jgi:hypothetical protein
LDFQHGASAFFQHSITKSEHYDYNSDHQIERGSFCLKRER